MHLNFSNYPNEDYEGVFTEIIHGHISDLDMEYLGTMDVNYQSSINEKWTVFAGDLLIEYDLKSLTVNVSPSGIQLGYNEFSSTIQDFAEIGGYSKREMANDIRDEIYNNQYNRYNEITAFGMYEDVSIKGDKMEFSMEDFGKITFNRVHK